MNDGANLEETQEFSQTYLVHKIRQKANREIFNMVDAVLIAEMDYFDDIEKMQSDIK